jgi:hypothetical protein
VEGATPDMYIHWTSGKIKIIKAYLPNINTRKRKISEEICDCILNDL